MGLRGEVYLELMPVGDTLRVVAIDPQTGTEVSVFGPASTPRADLEQLAIRKLRRRLARKRTEPPPKRPGLTV